MHLHILGICGTFMGGIAALARERGLAVTGSDQNVYPPMSTQLADLGVGLCQGYAPAHLAPAPDEVLIGNALSRGNPAVEHVLDTGLRYRSGAQWLAEELLPARRVLAVAGTHGKTTTTSLLAWLLDQAGAAPGFLIGGVPRNFGISARLGQGRDFVIEADEYDTAFFDKRAKFVHYRPQIALLNNLEFDHADIYPDLAAIERQFHHLVRTVPRNGLLLVNAADAALARVLQAGCWTPVQRFGIFGETAVDTAPEWTVEPLNADGSTLRFRRGDTVLGEARWGLLGRHNAANAMAAIAAAAAAGVSPASAIAALPGFLAPRRRLECLGEARGVTVHDDFAHHPTAIATTLAALRARLGGSDGSRLLAVLEPRSNSMRLGAHAADLPGALGAADRVWVLSRPELRWDARQTLAALGEKLRVVASAEELLDSLAAEAQAGDHVLFMSNGGFDAVQSRFLTRLGAGKT